MYGGITGFGYGNSLGGLLLGGAPKGRKGSTGASKKARPYTSKGVGAKEMPRGDIRYTSELSDIKAARKEARKIASEQRKRLTKTPGYKLYVKQYQNFLKEIAKYRLEHLTLEETVAIEQAIEQGRAADIPYLIADRDQHLRMLKAKHFPLWAAKEYTFDLHKPKSQREFHMAPYEQSMFRGIGDVEQSMALVPSSSSERLYSARVPRSLGSFIYGEPTGIGLPRRVGRVRNPSSGRYVSPSSEEFLQIVPFSER